MNHLMTNSTLLLNLLLYISLLPSQGLSAAENYQGGWFVRPLIGFSMLSDQEATGADTGDFNGPWDVDVSGGFTSGFGVGYSLQENFDLELFWEYRSNDSETRVSSANQSYDGNYASNVFYLNGIYRLSERNGFRPYLGVGLGLIQELDIDLELNSEERSFSEGGDFTMQLFAGADYAIADKTNLFGELRYGSASSITLEGEEGATGVVDGLDYNPFTMAVGIRRAF